VPAANVIIRKGITMPRDPYLAVVLDCEGHEVYQKAP